MADDDEEERVRVKLIPFKVVKPVQRKSSMNMNQPKTNSEEAIKVTSRGDAYLDVVPKKPYREMLSVRKKSESNDAVDETNRHIPLIRYPRYFAVLGEHEKEKRDADQKKEAMTEPRRDANLDVVPKKPYRIRYPRHLAVLGEHKKEKRDADQKKEAMTEPRRDANLDVVPKKPYRERFLQHLEEYEKEKRDADPKKRLLQHLGLLEEYEKEKRVADLKKRLLQHLGVLGENEKEKRDADQEMLNYIVHEGDKRMLKEMITTGFELNKLHIPRGVFSDIIRKQDTEMLKILIEGKLQLDQIHGLLFKHIIINRDIKVLNILIRGFEIKQFPDNVLMEIFQTCDKGMINLLKEEGLELSQLPDNVLMGILRTCDKRMPQSLKECGYELKQVPDKCIHKLVYNRDLNALQILVEEGLELKRIPDHCIHELVHNNDLAMLKVVLKGGFELKRIPDHFITKVVYKRNSEMLKIFVEGGWDVNRIPNHCLHELVCNRDIGMLTVLIEAGLELKRISEDAIDDLVNTRDIEILKALLKGGLEVKRIPDPVIDRLVHIDDVEMHNVLIERGLELKRLPRDTVTDITHSAKEYVKVGIRKFVSTILSPGYYIWTQFNRQEHDLDSRTDVDSERPPDGNITTKCMGGAKPVATVVQENDMKAFMSLKDTFVETYPHGEYPWRLLHTVAVNGTAEMVDCIQRWTRIDWDRQRTIHEDIFQGASEYPKVKKATALYLASCLDRTDIVRSLLKLAGEDNIRSCLQGLQLSNAMEHVFMLELADRLRQKHACLKPTIVLGHQNEDNATHSRVFIVYSVSVVQTEDYDFRGLGLVKLRNPYVLKKAKTFSSVGETDLSSEDAQRVREAIQTHRDRLWLRHSNLNIITGRYVKTKRNGLDIDEACVLLYCSTKGVIPLGEEEFPRTICTRHGDRINVVVREGFFRFGGYLTESSTRRHSTLKMGCEVGRLTPQYDASRNCIPNSCGTLGPFVRYNNNLGFLSCSHVFFDMPTHSFAMNFTAGFSKVEVAQPSTDSTASVNNTACGFVERAVFAPDHSISIDAAVVTLTDPSRVPSAGHFSNDHHSSYKTAGFDELPEYNNAFMLGDINALKSKPTVIKFGSKTDVTRGALNVVGTDVRPFAKELGFGGSSDKVLMKNQYLVTGIYPSMDFFDGGDSGSAVFCQDDNGQLVCVGMAIGHCVLNDYPYKAGIVTPIDAILQALGSNITLATFP